MVRRTKHYSHSTTWILQHLGTEVYLPAAVSSSVFSTTLRRYSPGKNHSSPRELISIVTPYLLVIYIFTPYLLLVIYIIFKPYLLLHNSKTSSCVFIDISLYSVDSTNLLNIITETFHYIQTITISNDLLCGYQKHHSSI